MNCRGVNVEIEEDLPAKYGFDFERVVVDMLDIVDQKDIFKLHQILIIDFPVTAEQRNRRGECYGLRAGFRVSRIVLYANNIFEPVLEPKLRNPILYEATFGETFYHEIGHHLVAFKHGIKKGELEGYVRRYSVEKTLKYIESKDQELARYMRENMTEDSFVFPADYYY